MSDLILTLTVALIGLVAAIGGSYLTVRAQVRAQVRLVQKDNALLYLWNRELVDHIYKGLGPPPPAPPAGLFKE